MINLIQIQRMDPRAIIPKTWSDLAIGYDLHAFLLTADGRPNTAIIPPRTTKMIGTGLIVKPPIGCFCSVWSRSGLATKSIWVANAPGLIDPDYRGEIQVLLHNGGHETYYVKHEERIAQLVLMSFLDTKVWEVQQLDSTARNTAGFGSTGR